MEEPERGWYPDPEDPSILRWWDGTAWGEQTRLDDSRVAPPAPETPPSELSPDTATPLANAAPVAAPPSSGAWGSSALSGSGPGVLRPPSASPPIPPTGPPPAGRPGGRRASSRRGRPSVILLLLVVVGGGVAAFLLTRSSDEDQAIEALEAEPAEVATPSGHVTVELPGECLGITTAELTAGGGQWGGLAATVGAQAIACGTGEDGGDAVVDALAQEGTGRLPPVAVLTLDRINALAPGVDAATTAELLARQFADLDEAGAGGAGDRARYTVDAVELGPSDRGTAAAFESHGPAGPRELRKGQVQFIGETVVVVIVSAPTGQDALADRVLKRAVASIQVS